MFGETIYADPEGVEALVRAGGDCPSVSRGLRERIIGEAMSARLSTVRRSQRGRAGVVLGLTLALAVFISRQPSLPTVLAEAVVFPLKLQKLEHSAARKTATTAFTETDSPDSLAWSQVESLSRLRRRQAHTLRSVFRS